MKKAHGDDTPTAKEKIREAAIALFARKGYDAATTSAIAKAAGVNEVTLFRIFGNKKALFHDAYLMMTPMTDNIDLSGLTGGEDVKKDLAIFFRGYMIRYVGHMPVYRLSLQLQDEMYEKELYSASFDKIRGLISQFVGYLDTMRDKGKIVARDFNALAEFMFSLLLVKAQDFSLAGDGPDGEVRDPSLIDRFAASYAEELFRVLKA